MNLYKVLIVDDEEEIRVGIIKKIDWKQYGFEIVGDAENGQDALEKSERLQPDVIMTDVRMPYMDGIELGKNLMRSIPQAKIIIFSGCDDFEYAQQAIKFNAIEYVLKPINSVELIEILKKLKVKLDQEYDEKRNVEILRKHYIESLPVLREQFLIGVIEGRINEEIWDEKINSMEFKFNEEYFVVGAIQFYKENSYSEEEILMPILIKNIAEDIMEKYCNYISFLYLDNVIVIGNLAEEEEKQLFINGLKEVSNSFKRIVGASISVGIGKIVQLPSHISMSYKSALSALEYRVILGDENPIYIEDVEPDNTYNLQFDDENERVLLSAIKISSEEEIASIMKSIFLNIKNPSIAFNQYKIYIMEVTTSLLKLAQNYNMNINEIFGNDFNGYNYLDEFKSIKDIEEWFIEKALIINKNIKKERVNSSTVLVEKAKEYIKNNFMDSELSVEKLCSEFHISQTYFSTIFKKETEMSFVNYVTEVRLEEAVKLLNTTDYKTYIIAEKVGYPEANYFSYVFKKKFKISPARYRKS